MRNIRVSLYAHPNNINKTQRDKQIRQERRQLNKIFENGRGSRFPFIRGAPALDGSTETLPAHFQEGRWEQDGCGQAFGFGEKGFLVSGRLSCAEFLSHSQRFMTPPAIAHHAPLSMGFSRQECWSVLPFPSSGFFPDLGMEPESPASLQVNSLPSEPARRLY